VSAAEYVALIRPSRSEVQLPAGGGQEDNAAEARVKALAGLAVSLRTNPVRYMNDFLEHQGLTVLLVSISCAPCAVFAVASAVTVNHNGLLIP